MPPRVSLELDTHWSSHIPVRASLAVVDPEAIFTCSGTLNCTCGRCCPHGAATLCFFHCSGRLRCHQVPPGAPVTVLLEARQFVDRSVGGARHQVLRVVTGEVLSTSSAPVAPGELLVIVLMGQNYHLSPICQGNIMAAWPLPKYASS